MRQLKYFIDGSGTVDDAFSFDVSSEDNVHRIVEDMADDYHTNHDGWEANWPLTFVILDEGNHELGRYLVDRETIPSFLARRLTGLTKLQNL